MHNDYSQTPLAKKLGLSENLSIYLENPPENYLELVSLPSINIPKNPALNTEFIHLFVKNKNHLTSVFPKLKTYLKLDGVFWVSWPKKTSSLESDLDENIIREIGLKNGLVDVKVCSFNEDYSALKFIYRLKDRENV